MSLKFPQWSATSRERRGFSSHHRCSYCRCSIGRAACPVDPPARSSAGTYSAGTAALERNRSAAAMGFPCQCCCLKQQSGTTEHPTKGVMVLTGGQSRGMNRPISAPVECERSLRLGRGDQNNCLDVMDRLQPLGCEAHLYFIRINRNYTEFFFLSLFGDLLLHIYIFYFYYYYFFSPRANKVTSSCNCNQRSFFLKYQI